MKIIKCGHLERGLTGDLAMETIQIKKNLKLLKDLTILLKSQQDVGMEQLFQAQENYSLGVLISMSNLGLAQIEILIDLKK